MKVGTDGMILGSWVEVKPDDHALDIGTGTGLLALMLAQKGVLKIEAVEVEKGAALQANENVSNSQWANRIAIHHTAIQEFQSKFQFDLIVSNPPFYATGPESGSASREIARQEKMLPIHDLVDSIVRLLKPTGRVAVILPTDRKRALEERLGVAGFFIHRMLRVRPTPDKPIHRVVIEFRKGFPEQVDISELIIRENSQYTESYRRLTGDFYLSYN